MTKPDFYREHALRTLAWYEQKARRDDDGSTVQWIDVTAADGIWRTTIAVLVTPHITPADDMTSGQ